MEKDQVQKNNATSEGNIVRVILPFKDLRSADFVRKQLKDLGTNIGNPIQTVFTSPTIGEQLQIQKRKAPVVSRQCVVYQLNVICVIQITSATLLVISISELKNIEPPPLVHM